MKNAYELAKKVSELSKEDLIQFLTELHAFVPENFEEYVKKDFLLDKHCFGNESEILDWLHK